MKFRLVLDQNGSYWLVNDDGEQFFDGQSWRAKVEIFSFSQVGECTIDEFINLIRRTPIQEI